MIVAIARRRKKKSSRCTLLLLLLIYSLYVQIVCSNVRDTLRYMISWLCVSYSCSMIISTSMHVPPQGQFNPLALC